MMDAGRQEIASEDIWDDSALIRSWDEALDEYKKYHSIYASGGGIEALAGAGYVRRQPENRVWCPQNANPEPSIPLAVRTPDHVDDTHETVIPETDTATVKDGAVDKGSAICDGEGDAGSRLHDPNTIGAVPPQARVGSVQDEGLKKLFMSWYYAGYYTGLYEGQQKQRPP